MVNIQEINDNELSERLTDHDTKGGALRVSVFEIKENYLGELPDEYTAHMMTARQSLEKETYHLNFHLNKIAAKSERKKFGFAVTDYDKLDESGQKINLEHFLGPHYDLALNKPLIRGQLGNDTLNSYFYYDEVEIPVNKVDFNKLYGEYSEKYPNHTGWFVYALMEPPYRLSALGTEIYKWGEYLLDFLQYFFGDLNQITIYSWSTDCSVIFDAGKEWWGSYFWTVYNPQKQWYIGIIASETD